MIPSAKLHHPVEEKPSIQVRQHCGEDYSMRNVEYFATNIVTECSGHS
uniref:Uncharacterized protein n=1 Tax=Arundo donax TaxID=35708 RepID=A0A0A8Y520_ARUDO